MKRLVCCWRRGQKVRFSDGVVREYTGMREDGVEKWVATDGTDRNWYLPHGVSAEDVNHGDAKIVRQTKRRSRKR